MLLYLLIYKVKKKKIKYMDYRRKINLNSTSRVADTEIMGSMGHV